jgi:tRNA threonylcarbamoyladenosine biosynthesis protein TsaB
VKILALDTATELCSAALWIDGDCRTRESSRPRGSGELILGMLAQLLEEAGLALSECDAIAFGRGPGAFTGVRLAVAVAQGLGFAAGLPLLPVSDLRALAQQAFTQPGGELAPSGTQRALICQDARMAQVYWGCFDWHGGARAASAEAVGDPAGVRVPGAWGGAAACGAGSGFEAYPVLLTVPAVRLGPVWGHMRPRAVEVAQLAAGDGLAGAVAPENALPVYLRDEVATPPSRN